MISKYGLNASDGYQNDGRTSLKSAPSGLWVLIALSLLLLLLTIAVVTEGASSLYNSSDIVSMVKVLTADHEELRIFAP